MSTRIEKVKIAFITATNQGNYRKALRLAQALKGADQLKVLDALFDAAKRLRLDRQSGEPLLEGTQQNLDGTIAITWSQRTRRPDGSETRTVSCAQLEPAKRGPGWVANEEIPDAIVDAVTRAAMEW